MNEILQRIKEISLIGNHSVLLIGNSDADGELVAQENAMLWYPSCGCGWFGHPQESCCCSSEELARWRHNKPKVDMEYRLIRPAWSKISGEIKLDKDPTDILEHAYNRFSLSPTQTTTICKVAQTIAKLDNSDKIKPQHVLEALQYRSR